MLHPIVTQFEHSQEQRQVLEATERDVVVTAGAGAGKTRTLVARYLGLLAHGHPLRSVVAVTFTRKAAREMRNRVREQIRGYLEQVDLGEDEQVRWQAVYRDLDAARIGTIHSLCTEILHAHPAEANVDPNFDLLDEGLANILRQQVVDSALIWAADDEMTVPLFGLLGEFNLRNHLGKLLTQRLDSADILAQLPANLMAHWQQILTRQQEQSLQSLRANPAWVQATTVLQLNQASKADDRIEQQRQNVLAILQSSAQTLAAQLSNLTNLASIDLRGGSSKVWPAGKTQLDQVKSALRTLRTLWQSQAALLSLTLSLLDENIASLLPRLKQLFYTANQHYAMLKSAQNKLDFDDLEAEALRLLKEHPAVRQRWQQDVQVILVDECQDTNRRQFELIEYLQGPQSQLFIVGDAKQSIYRFRGADVTLFRQKKQEALKVCELRTSYRAHRDLVEGLNDMLKPVLGEATTGTPAYIEPFAPLAPWREQPAFSMTLPHIELHLAIGRKSRGGLKQAATALVQRLSNLLASTKLTPANIAILCRSSTSFAVYENALEQAGLPFLTVAGRGFYQRPEIRDILNALQSLADPSDDLALVGLLRSPVLALSDEAIYHLCRARSEAQCSLWDMLQSLEVRQLKSMEAAQSVEAANDLTLPQPDLSPQDKQRAIRAVKLINKLRQHAGRIAVADLLKQFLDATAYRAALIGIGQRRAARNINKLLAAAQSSALLGLGEFLHYINNLRDTGSREGEARAIAEGVVQIMSVHAAKGLEFPVVVIGDAAYKNRESHNLILNPELGILLPLRDEEGNLSAIYQLGKELETDQEAAESKRLLYVAATRAREQLIINGNIDLTRKGQPTRLGDWLGQLAEPLGLTEVNLDVEPEGSQLLSLDLQIGQTPVDCTIYQAGWSWQPNPSPSPPPSEHPFNLPPPLLDPILPPENSNPDTELPQRVWQVVPAVKHPQAPAWVIGSLVHEALAAWYFPANNFEAWVKSRAYSYGLTDRRQLQHAATSTRRLLQRFRKHSLFQDMDQAEQRLHEIPYSLEVKGQIEHGTIDAMYRQNGRWTLVEFKTDTLRNEIDLSNLLTQKDYIAQIQRYHHAVTQLVGQKPNLILCFLDCMGEVRLKVDIL